MLQIVSEPARQKILQLVWRQERSAGEIAEHFNTTFGAVSQHLRVLREAGLVAVEPVGTRRIYSARPEALQALRAELDGFWNQALANFRERIDENRRHGGESDDTDEG